MYSKNSDEYNFVLVRNFCTGTGIHCHAGYTKQVLAHLRPTWLGQLCSHYGIIVLVSGTSSLWLRREILPSLTVTKEAAVNLLHHLCACRKEFKGPVAKLSVIGILHQEFMSSRC